jgi:hypothetical protein
MINLIKYLGLALIILLAGCSRIETGSVGILKHFGGEISPEPQTGFVWTIFDSMIGQVDCTETRVPLNDLRPSDSNGVLLDRLDIVVSFTLAQQQVPTFFIRTKELDEYKDESGHEITTVGLQIMQNIVRHAVQEETKKQALVVLAANLGEYESSILARAQSELNKGYPGVFTLVRVNVNHFVPPTAILDQANKTAALRSEVDRNAQELTLIAQRTQLEASKAAVEALALKSAMEASHLSASELTAWKNARAYELQATAMAIATKTIDLTKQPAAK